MLYKKWQKLKTMLTGQRSYRVQVHTSIFSMFDNREIG